MHERVARYFALVSLLLLGGSSYLEEESDAIPNSYLKAASAARVPADLLYAMALTESGRTVDEENGFRPWPWTLNIGGTGKVFVNRSLAQKELQRRLDEGKTLVDIGLMQVNWHYHSDKFDSAYQALNPIKNLAVGADILRSCYEREREWWLAVGCYHAPNSADRAGKYRERVRRYLDLYVSVSRKNKNLTEYSAE